MVELIDFSYARPLGNAIKDAGYAGVIRYLSSNPAKNLTPAEIRDYQNNKLEIGVVWEDIANAPLLGFDRGSIDAKKALTQANALGFPVSVPIYFACDWDTTPAQQVQIDDYLKGCASIIGAKRVGVYGSFYVVERCFNNKTASWFWQTLAWSGKQVSTHNHILQDLKDPKIASTDHNTSVDEWGGWTIGATPIPTMSTVLPELRDALKFAHDIEIGDNIDPQDQTLMAERLVALKNSETEALKKIDAIKNLIN